MRWIAERIAEQRLLWHLRKADAATLHTSADLPSDEADAIMRANLKRDADRHRNRLILHTLALIAVGAARARPGSKLSRLLLHLHGGRPFPGLARRGARACITIEWTVVPNAALTELRRRFRCDADARHRRDSRAWRERLHMPRMATFVEQMADSPASRSDILDVVTLGELARRLECPVEGDAAIEIRRVAKIEDAGPGDLTFLANPKYASKLAATTRERRDHERRGDSPAPCAVIRSAVAVPGLRARRAGAVAGRPPAAGIHALRVGRR